MINPITTQTQNQDVFQRYLDTLEDMKFIEAKAFRLPDSPSIALRFYYKRRDFIQAVSIFEYYYHYNLTIPRIMITVSKDHIRLYYESLYDFVINVNAKNIINEVRDFLRSKAENIEEIEDIAYRYAEKIYMLVYRKVVELLRSAKIDRKTKCMAVNVIGNIPHSPAINADNETQCWYMSWPDNGHYQCDDKYYIGLAEQKLEEIYKRINSKISLKPCYEFLYDDYDDDEDDP